MAMIRVALPTSILSVEQTPLLKAIKVHQVARWTSIFGVYEVIFYKEPSTGYSEFQEHERFIRAYWSYFFTPPYLRRLLIPRNLILKYVGALPPIRLITFNVSKKPRTGEIRAGYVYRDINGKLYAHIGDKTPYLVLNNCEEGLRALSVISTEGKIVECIEERPYFGPQLAFHSSLLEVLTEAERTSHCIIATDKKGEPPSSNTLCNTCRGEVTVLFGSPKYDLFEISQQEGISLQEYVDYVWNTIPEQRVVSVRTEEALIITMGIINMYLNLCEKSKENYFKKGGV
jgi:predicted SPOUT superfamily RNA methylase MTH1